MIRYQTFEIALHNRNNNFYAPVTPNQRDQGQTKERKAKKQAQQPSCWSHLNKGTEYMREQKTKVQEKKTIRSYLSPVPPTHPGRLT